MNYMQFSVLFSEQNGIRLNENFYLFRKPLELYDEKRDKTFPLKDLKTAWDTKLPGGKTIAETLENVEDFKMELDAKSKGSGAANEFKFNHADQRGQHGGLRSSKLPAEANVRITQKTPEAALKHFRKTHGASDHEWAYELDSQGFVHQYVEGNKSSVAISGRKDRMILHNHPGGGAFSDMDLISTSNSPAKGIVATSSKGGTYTFTKNGGHFKANKFVRAVKRAKMKGRDYNDAVRKWLSANEKEYGYRFKYTR